MGYTQKQNSSQPSFFKPIYLFTAANFPQNILVTMDIYIYIYTHICCAIKNINRLHWIVEIPIGTIRLRRSSATAANREKSRARSSPSSRTSCWPDFFMETTYMLPALIPTWVCPWAVVQSSCSSKQVVLQLDASTAQCRITPASAWRHIASCSAAVSPAHALNWFPRLTFFQGTLYCYFMPRNTCPNTVNVWYIFLPPFTTKISQM